MIKKILIPYDGSEYANRALELAIELADKYSAKILILNIFHSINYTIVSFPGVTIPTIFNENVKEIIERSIIKKATGYNFLINKGLIKQADYVFYEWKALTELAELLGIKYNGINDIIEPEIFNKNQRLSPDSLEILIIQIYSHFLKHKLLHTREFEKMIINFVEHT